MDTRNSGGLPLAYQSRVDSSPRKSNAKANWGIVFGALGLATCCCPFTGPIFATIGLFLSIKGLRLGDRNVAIFGIVVCSIALALGLFIIVVDIYRNLMGMEPWYKD